MTEWVDTRKKHEFYTLEGALKFINSRHGKKLMVHIEVRFYTDETMAYPGGAAMIVTKKQMGRVISSAWSETFIRKGGKLRLYESDTVISL